MADSEQNSVEVTPSAGNTVTEPITDDSKKPRRVGSEKTNDPVAKFSGLGVSFRGKLFGTADVKEPRGDAICSTAMGMLKAAVKTTGEHKQKIILRVNLSGITLVDSFNQLKIYEHPVNKISFISKDPTDNRAFGYIVTEKEGKHTFFGVRTEKAAEQVVITLRDLFQTVFDLKKKEAELKGQVKEEPSSTETPANETSKQDTVDTAVEAKQPSLGEEQTTTDSKPEVKREDSQSHLLDLLDNLSFVEQTPAPNATQAFNQSSPWPPVATSAPAQNDPFAVQSQPNLFGQPLQVSQQQQPSFNQQVPSAAFTQPAPNNMPMMFNQPNQPLAYQQPSQFQPNANPFPGNTAAFSAQPAVQPAFTAPNMNFQSAGLFGAQQQTVNPLSQNGSVNGTGFISTAPASNPFQSDPFSTNLPQQPNPSVAVSRNNPFNSTQADMTGWLQPQSVQPPSQPQPASQASLDLFSDLNPISSSNPSVRKDQFFNDVKNPPKPKLNELTATKDLPIQAPTNNNFSSHDQIPINHNIDLSWIENQAPVVKQAENTPSVKPGLISPPPRCQRQRQHNAVSAPMARPR